MGLEFFVWYLRYIVKGEIYTPIQENGKSDSIEGKELTNTIMLHVINSRP